MPSTDDDEALARALQEEFDRDNERRSSTRQSANNRHSTAAQDPRALDEATARRLEQEMKHEELARRRSEEETRRRRRRSNMARKSLSSQQQQNQEPRAPRRTSDAAARSSPTSSGGSSPHPPPSAPVEAEMRTSTRSHSGPNRSSRTTSPSDADNRAAVQVKSVRKSRKEPLNDTTPPTTTAGRSSSRPLDSSQRGELRSSSHHRRSESASKSRGDNSRSMLKTRASSDMAQSTSNMNQSNHVSDTNDRSSPQNNNTEQQHLSASRHSVMSNRTAKDLELAKRLEQEAKDEELARKLMEEEEKQRRTTETSTHSQRNLSSHGKSSSQRDASGRSRSSGHLAASTHSMRNASTHSLRDSNARSSSEQAVATSTPIEDLEIAELAQKLEQEERDEELARSIMKREQERRSQRMVNTASVDPRRGGWTWRRVLSLAIPALVIIAAAVGLVIAFTGNGGSLFGGFAPFQDTDPYDGVTVNPEDANSWRNNGKGLKLTLLNALQEQWDTPFDIAVTDWDSGTPDALTLTTERVAYDLSCSRVDGKLKVCNGDYGDTKWRGINQVILSNGWIIASTAKMNEYYLATADTAQRQYTMCHEIGHGFGLPHSDENFYNKDLGNCMDYTTNPAVNQKPDESQYQFLADLYGTVSRRFRRRHLSEPLGIPETLSDDVEAAYDKAVQELEFGQKQGWSLLHKSKHGEAHSKDLGHGYTLEVHMLLHVDE